MVARDYEVSLGEELPHLLFAYAKQLRRYRDITGDWSGHGRRLIQGQVKAIYRNFCWSAAIAVSVIFFVFVFARMCVHLLRVCVCVSVHRENF